MARYFFNFEGRNPPDEEGEELRDDDAAMDAAIRTMRELVSQAVFAGEDELLPGRLIVTDGSGREVFTIKPKDVLSKSLR